MLGNFCFRLIHLNCRNASKHINITSHNNKFINFRNSFSDRQFSYKSLIPKTSTCNFPYICWLHRTIFSNKFVCRTCTTDAFLDDDSFEELLKESEHKALRKNIYRLPDEGHNVLLIQPKIKWGPKKLTNTTPELQLLEAKALVETLPGWRVVHEVIVPVISPDKTELFGTGKQESLKELMYSHANITAVFVASNKLKTGQMIALSNLFGVPVYDRYIIVLEIFQNHAKTMEAKLQVALAEIPYLRLRIQEHFLTRKGITGKWANHLGGYGRIPTETRRFLLQEREVQIKRQLQRLSKQRNLIRSNRDTKQIPSIAVVGYTNAGKTSLIKVLTDDIRLVPKNHLFATLDVTVHAGVLPSYVKVLYVDTVGFISDIPISLIHSFSATLHDAVIADLIIHVRDISHPDKEAQNDEVIQTLGRLNISEQLMNSMVVVGNKIDQLSSESVNEISGVDYLISCTKGTGLTELKHEIEKRLLKNTGLRCEVFKVPAGGEESRWLYKFAAVKDVVVDEDDPNYLLMEVIIGPAAYGKFNHYFGNLSVLESEE